MVTNSAIPVLLVALLWPAFPQQPTREARQRQSTAQTATQAADALSEAENLLQNQQFAAAEEKIQSVVSRNADNPQAWFDLGFAESHLNKKKEAFTAYRRATELSPKWFEAQLNLGLALAKAGDNSEAGTALKKAVTLQPSKGGNQALSKAWSALGQVLEDLQPQDAVAAYRKAAELDPEAADDYQRAASVLERTGDLAGAEQQYRQAAQLGSTSAMEQLINLFLQQKRLPDGEIWLKKYLEANPGSGAAQAQLGKVLAAEGKKQEAIAAMEKLNASGQPSDPAVVRQLAALYLDDKQYDRAAALLQPLLATAPADALLHWNYGEALLHLHKYPEAETELIQALKTNGGIREAYWELAYAAQENKHYELAIRALDARAKFLPENAATYWLRAISYDNLRAYKPAIENYKLFLSASAGKSPDQEFQARHRIKALEPN